MENCLINQYGNRVCTQPAPPSAEIVGNADLLAEDLTGIEEISKFVVDQIQEILLELFKNDSKTALFGLFGLIGLGSLIRIGAGRIIAGCAAQIGICLKQFIMRRIRKFLGPRMTRKLIIIKLISLS